MAFFINSFLQSIVSKCNFVGTANYIYIVTDIVLSITMSNWRREHLNSATSHDQWFGLYLDAVGDTLPLQWASLSRMHSQIHKNIPFLTKFSILQSVGYNFNFAGMANSIFIVTDSVSSIKLVIWRREHHLFSISIYWNYPLTMSNF